MQLSYFAAFEFLNFWIFEFLNFWCWHVVLDDSKNLFKNLTTIFAVFCSKVELSTDKHKFYDMERGVYHKVGKFMATGIQRKLLPPLLLVYSHDGRIYHQEVLNLAAPDFLFWENQLALPQLNRFLSAERGCLLAHLFSLALFWTHQWTQIVCMQIILKPVPTLMKINLPTCTRLSIQTIMGATAIGVLQRSEFYFKFSMNKS